LGFPFLLPAVNLPQVRNTIVAKATFRWRSARINDEYLHKDLVGEIEEN